MWYLPLKGRKPKEDSFLINSCRWFKSEPCGIWCYSVDICHQMRSDLQEVKGISRNVPKITGTNLICHVLKTVIQHPVHPETATSYGCGSDQYTGFEVYFLPIQNRHYRLCCFLPLWNFPFSSQPHLLTWRFHLHLVLPLAPHHQSPQHAVQAADGVVYRIYRWPVRSGTRYSCQTLDRLFLLKRQRWVSWERW